MSSEKAAAGLADVIAGDTAISLVTKEGKGLYYRGYSVADFTEQGCFEEVAYLLIHGNLPSAQELQTYQTKLIRGRELPVTLKTLLEQLPAQAHPMDILRTACSALGSLESELDPTQGRDIADRLLAIFPSALFYWHHFHKHHQRIDTVTEAKGLAEHILWLIAGKKPGEQYRKALDVSLMLYAEHEFNASTFAARVTTATLSDFYSAITSAIGTLRGPLHGGANQAAMELMERFASPEEAERGIYKMLEHKEKIMGFGHRVYKISDPRSDILKSHVVKLAGQDPERLRLYAIAEKIESIMRAEKHLFPNVDFYSAPLYRFCGIETRMFTPLFAMARTSGWSAHVLEQREDNKLIRPAARYIGPTPRAYISIDQR